MSASDYGFKVSTPGVDVKTAATEDLVVTTSVPMLKCDLRSTPKHYGTINFTVASVPVAVTIPGVSFTPGYVLIYQVAHGYTYKPSFLTAWNYPAGTAPSDPTSNATFGIGDIDCSLSSGLIFSMITDATNFTVYVSNNDTVVHSASGTIRFYIFADSFTAV